MEQIIQTGTVTRGWIGVSQEITAGNCRESRLSAIGVISATPIQPRVTVAPSG